MPNSSRLAFDWMLAPASWRSLTTVASNGEVKPERTLEAAVVGLDAVTMLSLTAIDLPASEPGIVRQCHSRRCSCSLLLPVVAPMASLMWWMVCSSPLGFCCALTLC
jgi:hypothetical protein